MNKDGLKKLFLGSLSGFLSLALAILLFFCIQRADGLRQSLQWLKGVLMPFVYGGTMAYLLKTPCGFLEGKLEAALPEKYRKYAVALSVVSVLLIAVLVLYLLTSMVLPEMASSVIVLANAVPGKIDQLTQWVLAHLEGNEVLQNYVNTAFENVENWLTNWATTDLLPTMQNMMGGVVNTVGSVITVLKTLCWESLSAYTCCSGAKNWPATARRWCMPC